MYLGTFVLGGGITMGNVLLPSLLKHDFTGHIAATTAVYVVIIGIVATLGSAFIMPLIESLQGDWRLLLVLAILYWLPQITMHRHVGGLGTRPVSCIAAVFGGHCWYVWQVTIFSA